MPQRAGPTNAIVTAGVKRAPERRTASMRDQEYEEVERAVEVDGNSAAPKLSKEEKLAKEKTLLLEKLACGATDTIPARVAWILNRYPQARDSDVTLQVIFWKTFNHDLLSGPVVPLENLYKLTRLTDITRARAKIQNEYHIFKASDGIRRRRGAKEGQERERQIDDQPGFPTLTVYADESGKTADNLIVGSMWFLSGMDVHPVFVAIEEWRTNTGFKDELHFNKISEGNVNRYFEVLDILDTFASTVSFRAITIMRRGHTDTSRVLDDLLLHLLIRGVAHEHESGRAMLPRSISVFKDAEEESRDRLVTANLMLDLQNASKSRFDSNLHVSCVEAVSSKNLVFIQLADLFNGSLNRLLNVGNDATSNHCKDRFARTFLNRFGNKSNREAYEQGGDMTVIEKM
jgi:hypothetical protein